MKACIFGAGALGGQLAIRLCQAEVETSVIARRAQLASIRASGLRLRHEGAEIAASLPASDDPRELGRQDFVFVTVKAHALAQLPQR